MTPSIRMISILLAIIPQLNCAHAELAEPAKDWGSVLHPTQGPSKTIGFYTRGCIDGANTLPLDGTGFQIMRPFRNRNHGHEILTEFLKNFAKQVDAIDSGLLIGDLSQPRGGPMPYGHTSHQVGLDADIWFWTHPEQRVRSLSLEERNTLPFVTTLNANGVVDPNKFQEEHIQKLRFAAASPLVQRIFINPAIKVYLCSTLKKNDLSWLQKLRPWPGHHEHFHVRLFCPLNDKTCEPQAAVPDGDGCSEVIPARREKHLLTDTEQNPNNEQIDQEHNDDFFDKIKPKELVLPKQCDAILKQ